MWEDPIVMEVRRVRSEIEEECAADFDQIYQHALEIQKKIIDELVSDPKTKGKEGKVIVEA